MKLVSQETLSAQLAGVLRDRENHARALELKALRAGERVSLWWGDAYTRECGLLAVIDESQAPDAVPLLLAQLRRWREHCESACTPAAMGARA